MIESETSSINDGINDDILGDHLLLAARISAISGIGEFARIQEMMFMACSFNIHDKDCYIEALPYLTFGGMGPFGGIGFGSEFSSNDFRKDELNTRAQKDQLEQLELECEVLRDSDINGLRPYKRKHNPITGNYIKRKWR